jgi:hypothetical protein
VLTMRYSRETSLSARDPDPISPLCHEGRSGLIVYFASCGAPGLEQNSGLPSDTFNLRKRCLLVLKAPVFSLHTYKYDWPAATSTNHFSLHCHFSPITIFKPSEWQAHHQHSAMCQPCKTMQSTIRSTSSDIPNTMCSVRA